MFVKSGEVGEGGDVLLDHIPGGLVHLPAASRLVGLGVVGKSSTLSRVVRTPGGVVSVELSCVVKDLCNNRNGSNVEGVVDND
jgi:hypothetical protein